MSGRVAGEGGAGRDAKGGRRQWREGEEGQASGSVKGERQVQPIRDEMELLESERRILIPRCCTEEREKKRGGREEEKEGQN